jgi:hypothetical protein
VPWYTPVIPALRRVRQEDLEFEVCLDYTERPCLKKNKLHIFKRLVFSKVAHCHLQQRESTHTKLSECSQQPGLSATPSGLFSVAGFSASAGEPTPSDSTRPGGKAWPSCPVWDSSARPFYLQASCVAAGNCWAYIPLLLPPFHSPGPSPGPSLKSEYTFWRIQWMAPALNRLFPLSQKCLESDPNKLHTMNLGIMFPQPHPHPAVPTPPCHSQASAPPREPSHWPLCF